MGSLSAPIGVGSAFTGLGAQIAAAPTVDFMLGYAADKIAGTAMLVALCAAVAGASAAALGGTPVHLGQALLVTVGATLGVMVFGVRQAGPRLKRWRLLAQSLMMLVLLYTMSAALRGGMLGPAAFHMPWAQGSAGLLGVGFVCGLLSATFEVSTGALLVPALVFASAKRPDEAIVISLVVVALASLLPVLGHLAARRLEPTMCAWMGAGSLGGGLLGGMLVARCGEAMHPAPLLVFGALAMFAGASYLRRATFESDDEPGDLDGPPSDEDAS